MSTEPKQILSILSYYEVKYHKFQDNANYIHRKSKQIARFSDYFNLHMIKIVVEDSLTYNQNFKHFSMVKVLMYLRVIKNYITRSYNTYNKTVTVLS